MTPIENPVVALVVGAFLGGLVVFFCMGAIMLRVLGDVSSKGS